MAPLVFFYHHHPSWVPNFTARNCCTSKSISVCLLLFCHRLLRYNSTVQYTLRSVGRPSSSSRIWYVCASQHARNPRLYNGALLLLLVSPPPSIRLPHSCSARDPLPQTHGICFLRSALGTPRKIKEKQLHKPVSSEKIIQLSHPACLSLAILLRFFTIFSSTPTFLAGWQNGSLFGV